MNLFCCWKTNLKIYSANWQMLMEYRAMLFINAIRLILLPVVLVSAWLSIEKTASNPYGNADYIFYYLMVPLVLNFTDARTVFRFPESIRNGTLNRELLKPYPPLLLYVIESLTNKTVQLLYLIPITLIGFFFLKPYLPVIPITTEIAVLFVLALIGGAIVRFAISSSIALLGFWLEDVTTLNLVLNGGIWALLGGMIVPVETFPENFRVIANSLPYRYMLSFPIEILRGKLSLSDIASGFGVIAFWTIIFSIIIRVIWKQGLKNYSAYGG